MTDLRKDQLEGAPGFDKNDWPMTPEPEFVTRVYTHYGYEPYYDREIAM